MLSIFSFSPSSKEFWKSSEKYYRFRLPHRNFCAVPRETFLFLLQDFMPLYILPGRLMTSTTTAIIQVRFHKAAAICSPKSAAAAVQGHSAVKNYTLKSHWWEFKSRAVYFTVQSLAWLFRNTIHWDWWGLRPTKFQKFVPFQWYVTYIYLWISPNGVDKSDSGIIVHERQEIGVLARLVRSFANRLYVRPELNLFWKILLFL